MASSLRGKVSVRGMGAGSPGCRVPGARAALEAAGSARPSGTRLCLSDGATGWTGSGPEHSRLPRSPGPLGLAPLAALPVLHLSSSDQALPPLLHPPLWGVSSGAPPPLQALGTWGRDWDTGEHENGAGTVILFPIGSPSRPSAPAPSGPGPAPSGPTGCPSGLGPWSPHCLFLLPGRLEATQPRLPGGRSSAVHGPVLPAVLPVLPTSAGKRHSTAQGQLPVPRPSRLLLLAPALAWGWAG